MLKFSVVLDLEFWDVACSQMLGRLYLPMFLLRFGLFTLKNMDSLIALASLALTTYYAEVIQGVRVASGVLVAIYG